MDMDLVCGQGLGRIGARQILTRLTFRFDVEPEAEMIDPGAQNTADVWCWQESIKDQAQVSGWICLPISPPISQ